MKQVILISLLLGLLIFHRQWVTTHGADDIRMPEGEQIYFEHGEEPERFVVPPGCGELPSAMGPSPYDTEPHLEWFKAPNGDLWQCIVFWR